MTISYEELSRTSAELRQRTGPVGGLEGALRLWETVQPRSAGMPRWAGGGAVATKTRTAMANEALRSRRTRDRGGPAGQVSSAPTQGISDYCGTLGAA
jgi:hypothetical protein